MPRTAAANNMADDDRVDKSKLIRIKITSLGDGGTGKSCIIKNVNPTPGLLDGRNSLAIAEALSLSAKYSRKEKVKL